MKVESLALGNFDSSSNMENNPRGLRKKCITIVIIEYKASGYAVYLLVNNILSVTLHLLMLYWQLEDQQVTIPT